MDVMDFIFKEQTKQCSRASAVVQAFEEFKKELLCGEMPIEFMEKTARYVVFLAVKHNGEFCSERYAFRTLKGVIELSNGTGGLYNHSFKWEKLKRKITWSYVDNLKEPLVSVIVLKYDIPLGELKGGNDNGEEN